MAPHPRLLAALSLGAAVAVASLALPRGPSPAISPEPAPQAPASAPASALASASEVGAMPRAPVMEPDPDEEIAYEPEPEPPPLDARWKAEPGAATLALARKLRPLYERFARGGVQEVHGDDFDIVYPAASRLALRRLKEASLAVVEARMAEAAAIAQGAPVPARGLDEFFQKALVAGLPGEDAVTARATGALGGRLFGVIFGYGLAGGNDDTLALFERLPSGAYRRAMVVARHDHASITSGLLALDFEARPLAGGGYHVITTHSSPWISSLWRGVRLRIFEPTADPDRPRLLLDESNSARIGESGASLRGDAEGFTASFASWAQFFGPDEDVVRTHVHRFVLDGGAYRRAAPYVRRDRDLPDEWLNSPWAEAQAFTVEDARERLRPVHRRMSTRETRDRLGRELIGSRDGERRLFTASSQGDSCPTFVVVKQGGQPRIADVVEGPCRAPPPRAGGPDAPL